MLTPGNIIYFDPFYFKNGNVAKPKYFLVISSDESNSLIASLPTSVDYVPSHIDQNTGCCELPEANFNCFILKAGDVVTKCQKSFRVNTYLYGQNLDSYEIEHMHEIYPTEDVDYTIWGVMEEDIFKQVIHCFLSSDSVKNKHKKAIKKQP